MAMQWMRKQSQDNEKAPPWLKSTSTRRSWLMYYAIGIFSLAICGLYFMRSRPRTTPDPDIYWNEPEHPGFFEWQTNSSFSPVRIENAHEKSVEELCASFPEHLLEKIQPVLKTGHGVLESRVRPQLQGASACLSNLLIFSDVGEIVEGRQMVDVLKDIPEKLSKGVEDLKAYWNGSIADGSASRRAGWRADKFKFILSATRAWMQRSGREWYVFYEADTYIVWDNLFRLLEKFDPDEPWYFGYPSPGGDRLWFANGGPGYVLSREAMRRLTRPDFDQETGHYIGPEMLRKYWRLLDEDCCGDSVLGWMLWNQNVTLSGLSPMFSRHPPHGVPFGDRYWCQPIITMHKPAEDLMNLWRWEYEQRVSDRPLLFRDLATTYLYMNSLGTREDWNNAAFDSFVAPFPSKAYTRDPHESFDACDQACLAHGECFQWTYHLKKCHFVHSFRYGRYEDPGLGKARLKWHPGESEDEWEPRDLKWMSGWDAKKISDWISHHPCDEVKWVKPSTKRTF